MYISLLKKLRMGHILLAATVFVLSCTRNTAPRMGGGSFPICICHTNGAGTSYGLGTTYKAADTSMYQDSCNALKKINNLDTCVVSIEAL